MSLTPPSSHGGGTPVAPGIVTATISSTPVGDYGETPESNFAQQVYVTVTTIPMVVGASTLVADFDVALANVPDISDDLDISITIFVTDQTGTNTLTVTAEFSTPTPVSSYAVDLTGTSATIVGVDLTWSDGPTGSVTSTAGGIYSATLLVIAGPD